LTLYFKKASMKKALFSIVLYSIALITYAQRNSNALYPPELLVESLCPIDTMFVEYSKGEPWADMYFSITDYTNGRLPYIFTEMASDNRFNGYSTELMTDFYPYDYKKYAVLNESGLFKAFGGDTLIATTSEGEEAKLIKLVDTLEIMAVNFIEEWQLDTANASFNKSVKAIVPVLCYTHPAFEGIYYRRSCIIARKDPSEKSLNPELVARVKYEAPLFHQDEETTGYLPSEELFYRELLCSPFLSSYSRIMLVRFLEDSALDNKLKCFSFNTGKIITDSDTIMYGLGYARFHTQIDLGTGEYRDTAYIDREYYVNSIVFYEDWFIDRKTAQFSKKVTGIAPVLWDLMDNKKRVKIFVRFEEE